MRITLDSALKKRALIAVYACLFAYLTVVSTQFLADRLASDLESGSLHAALKLDRGNADYYSRLARYYDWIRNDNSSAIVQDEKAVQLNPYNARFWLDLAALYAVNGDSESQMRAIEHAVQVDPTSPKVAWDAANLYVARGQTEAALRQFHVVMEGDPYLPETAMRTCWRIAPDVDLLLKDVIPARVNSYLSFLGLLMSKEETAGSLKVWDALISLHQQIEIQPIFNYIRYLLLHRSPDEAALVWREAASLLGLNAYLPSSNNLIVNGDFHLDVLNGGFDWQHQKRSSVSLSLDTSEFHGGHRSLAISFDGPGVVDAGVFQVITVKPNTTYQFSGHYRNGEMEGAGGLHFSLEDLYSSQSYFLSDELKFGSVWKSVSAEFTTGPETKVLVLRVQRLPAGSPLRGKIWIDDFRLVEKPVAEGSG
jgi:tetratricopeptide (TPR) repeat protein